MARILCFFLMLSIVVSITFEFEYGTPEECEKEAFRHKGQLPATQLIYRLNVSHTTEELKPDFTYLFVKYDRGVTKLDIQYDNISHIMTFKKRYPLRRVDIEVVGYAKPVKKKECYNGLK